ncbi:MAG: hypothetical protein KF830_12060 [Planctomycetes bacterium]|nr:hypothetical protein [Planctomycetota bacterium]
MSPVPAASTTLDLAELARRPTGDLAALAVRLGIDPDPALDHGDLVLAVLARHLAAGGSGRGDGVLEVLADGFGFLRQPHADCRPQPFDVYVSPAQIQHLHLRPGHRLAGPLRAPRAGERCLGLAHVDLVNGGGDTALAARVPFAARRPLLATRRLALAPTGDPDLRAIDLLSPWAHGHRVLAVLPPDADGGAWLLRLACALRQQAPALRRVVALLDQRPEVLAHGHHAGDADPHTTLLGSTFDEPPARHGAVADLALAVAQREVEAGHDVVLLVDALHRLARACNLDRAPSGRLLCAGFDAGAVQPGKRLFAAARACAEGGSLTVVATTAAGDHPVDRAVLDQFRHRGNAEVAFAASDLPGAMELDVAGTFTRAEDLPLPPAQAAGWRQLRRTLLAAPAERRHAELAARLSAAADNAALLRESAP